MDQSNRRRGKGTVPSGDFALQLWKVCNSLDRPWYDSIQTTPQNSKSSGIRWCRYLLGYANCSLSWGVTVSRSSWIWRNLWFFFFFFFFFSYCQLTANKSSQAFRAVTAGASTCPHHNHNDSHKSHGKTNNVINDKRSKSVRRRRVLLLACQDHREVGVLLKEELGDSQHQSQ